MSTVRQVDAAWAREIAALLELRDKPAEVVLRSVGLDPKKVQDPDARIPFAKQASLLDAAAEHLGDPCFGLHVGSRLNILDAGAVGYLAKHSANLKESLQNLASFIRVFSEGVRLRLEVEDQLAIFTVSVIDLEVRQRPQIEEFGLALAMNACRFVTGRRLAPEWVEFRHHRSNELDEFERYFGATVHFGRRRNAIVFSRSILDLPCKSQDARLLRILKAYCEEILRNRPERKELGHDVEHLVATLLPSGNVTSHRVARELGMSKRTLGRRLDKLGISFGQILDRVRYQLALRYLGEPEVKISQISYLLGYSEPSAFNHAFRRWTGKSPSEFEAAH